MYTIYVPKLHIKCTFLQVFPILPNIKLKSLVNTTVLPNYILTAVIWPNEAFGLDHLAYLFRHMLRSGNHCSYTPWHFIGKTIMNEQLC